jgi:uncharacterized membrane protein YhaH (DUF805 family)
MKMERVEHKVLALLPEFNNGPVGRMDFFKSYLGLIGMCFVTVIVSGVFIETGGDLGAILGTLAFLALGIWTLVHSVALVYKRLWDIGYEDTGTRTGMTIGYFIVSFFPMLNLVAGLALMFWPRKEEVLEA